MPWKISLSWPHQSSASSARYSASGSGSGLAFYLGKPFIQPSAPTKAPTAIGHTGLRWVYSIT